MGGRGASSGISDKGRPYGSEYMTLLTSGNVKFVRYNDSASAKTPQETMTKGRVYVTVNAEDKLVSVTYYDVNGKRRKSIDLTHPHNGMELHVHHGYNHKEYDGPKGATNLNEKERKMVERIYKIWQNRRGR